MRINETINVFGPDATFVGHSGGKDSVVIHSLTKLAGLNLQVIHNVKPMLHTSGDEVAALTEMWPQTLEFLYTNVCAESRVTFMKSTEMELYLKEKKLTCQIDGARIVESDRAGKSANFMRKGELLSRSEIQVFEPDGMFGLSVLYPIYDWTDDDVFDYILDNGLKLSPEYGINGELSHHQLRRRQQALKIEE